MVQILGVCGSLQHRSRNLDLLRTAAATAPPGVVVTIFDGLGDLPHFNPDLDAEAVPAVRRWRDALDASDAVLIACPEYAFSLPGVLKNAIDWVVGTGELERKLVGVTAASHHPERGRRGLAALLDPLAALSAEVVGGEPIARGPGAEAAIAALVRALAGRVPDRQSR